MRTLIAAATLIMTGAPAAHAAVDPETFTVSAYSNSKDGQFSGCTLEFSGVAADFTYMKGAPVAYYGGISNNLVERDGKAWMTPAFKLKPGDVTSVHGQPDVAVFVPATIALIDKQGFANGASVKGSQESDTGGRFSFFDFDDEWMSVQEAMVQTNSLQFTFNRHPGGQDVRVKVDLTVNDASKPGGNPALRDWLDCNIKLAELVASKSKK